MNISFDIFNHIHILVPFGRKVEEEVTFRLLRNDRSGTELAADLPCVHIDPDLDRIISFSNINEGIFNDSFPKMEDGREAFRFVGAFLLQHLKDLRESQVTFLNLYFNCCYSIGEPDEKQGSDKSRADSVKGDPNWPFAAPLPMANAHLYIGSERDPKTGSDEKVMADILFWTEHRFIAIELVDDDDLRSHLKRIRTFLRNNIEPVIIFAEEMKKDRENALCRHLPPEILNFWLHYPGKPRNPLSPLRFVRKEDSK